MWNERRLWNTRVCCVSPPSSSDSVGVAYPHHANHARPAGGIGSDVFCSRSHLAPTAGASACWFRGLFSETRREESFQLSLTVIRNPWALRESIPGSRLGVRNCAAGCLLPRSRNELTQCRCRDIVNVPKCRCDLLQLIGRHLVLFEVHLPLAHRPPDSRDALGGDLRGQRECLATSERVVESSDLRICVPSTTATAMHESVSASTAISTEEVWPTRMRRSARTIGATNKLSIMASASGI